MSYVTISHWLILDRVIVVKFAAQKTEPILQQKHPIVHEVRGTSFDQQDLTLWEIYCQAIRKDAASGTSSDYDEVKTVMIHGGEAITR